MKRSEMEIYLEQHLIELRGYQEDNAEIVDVLLYAIEEAGMLPPPYEKILDGSNEKKEAKNKPFVDSLGNQVGFTTVMPNYCKVSEWEPEEEE